MTVVERVTHLERENRWLKRFGSVAIALMSVILLVGQEKQKDLADLVGKSLTLRTADGFVWLEAKPKKNGGLLQLNTDKPFAGIRLETGRRQKGIAIVNDRFEIQVVLGTVDGVPQIALAKEDGSPCVWIGEHPDGHGMFGAYDKDKKLAWRVPANARWPIKETELARRAHRKCKEYWDRVKSWRRTHGHKWPRSLEDVVGKVELDPWGNRYRLVIDGDKAYVISLGPDGKEGTKDDTLWWPRDD